MLERDIWFFQDGLQAMKGSGDLKGALGNLIQLAASAAQSKASSFYIKDETGQFLKPLATWGLSESYITNCGKVTIGEQCCGRAVAHRKPWIVTDMLNDPLFASARQAAVESSIRAAFSVPVINAEDDVIGSLACHFSDVHTPTSTDIERNLIWASLIAYTITEYKNAGQKAPPQQQSAIV
jgi:signal transduction protein with GAF and PtsI domain